MTSFPIEIRQAVMSDLQSIVELLADDAMGRTREDARLPIAEVYNAAFAAIDTDPNQILAVAERGGKLVAVLQLTIIPGLSRMGAWRGQIESVRVARTERGAGLGQQMFEWAIAQSRHRGCGLVQLTTDKSRSSAHRFYEALGFTATHIGYKLDLR